MQMLSFFAEMTRRSNYNSICSDPKLQMWLSGAERSGSHVAPVIIIHDDAGKRERAGPMSFESLTLITRAVFKCWNLVRKTAVFFHAVHREQRWCRSDERMLNMPRMQRGASSRESKSHRTQLVHEKLLHTKWQVMPPPHLVLTTLQLPVLD